MQLLELQKRVEEFVEEHQLSTSLEVRILDLLSELGELSKEVLKSSSYGQNDFVTSKAFEDEFGDLLFSLICMANSAGVNMEKALENSLKKYKKRMTDGGQIGSLE